MLFRSVKKVQVLEAGNTISRELLLIKVKNSPEIRPEIMAATEVYRGKIIDYAADVMSVEVTGEPVKIDSFIELMKPMGILEMCRTGIVAIERGKGTLLTVE